MESGYRVRALTKSDGEEIARWRYPAPYDIYNSAPEGASAETLAAVAAYFVEPVHAYFAVDGSEGGLVGFCCFGEEAQVPGYDYTQECALDIGFGLRPDATGQGRGQPFLAAIQGFGLARFQPAALRATVADFNERSARTFLRAGFAPAARFAGRHPPHLAFTVYTRRA